MKRPLPPIPTPEGTPFQKFDCLVSTVLSVPKAQIDKEEAKWKKARARKNRAKKA